MTNIVAMESGWTAMVEISSQDVEKYAAILNCIHDILERLNEEETGKHDIEKWAQVQKTFLIEIGQLNEMVRVREIKDKNFVLTVLEQGMMHLFQMIIILDDDLCSKAPRRSVFWNLVKELEVCFVECFESVYKADTGAHIKALEIEIARLERKRREHSKPQSVKISLQNRVAETSLLAFLDTPPKMGELTQHVGFKLDKAHVGLQRAERKQEHAAETSDEAFLCRFHEIITREGCKIETKALSSIIAILLRIAIRMIKSRKPHLSVNDNLRNLARLYSFKIASPTLKVDHGLEIETIMKKINDDELKLSIIEDQLDNSSCDGDDRRILNIDRMRLKDALSEKVRQKIVLEEGLRGKDHQAIIKLFHFVKQKLVPMVYYVEDLDKHFEAWGFEDKL
jgi:hypothetical protein